MRIASICVGMLVVSGCQQAPAVDLAPTEKRLTALEAQMSALQVDSLVNKYGIQDLKEKGESAASAVFNPAEAGFYNVPSPTAPLLVAIKSIDKHGNGTKLSLVTGNLTLGYMSNVEFQIRYGHKQGSKEEYESWANSLQTTTAKINGVIAPGTWTPAEITLAGVAPEDLSYVEMAGNIGTLSLRNVN